jgi:outer membrane protein assembly factor BamB
VAWCVPVESTGEARAAGLTDGYSATPVVASGVVYTQDLESNVMATRLATGKVPWTRDYSSPNGGPDGVNVAGGVVCVSTTTYSGYLYAFSAATGAILLKTALSSGSNAPVAVDGDYVLAGAGVQAPKDGRQLIIASSAPPAASSPTPSASRRPVSPGRAAATPGTAAGRRGRTRC